MVQSIPFHRQGKLTGKKRYRVSIFGKVILQVETEIVEFNPGYHCPAPDLIGTRWRDATSEDIEVFKEF